MDAFFVDGVRLNDPSNAFLIRDVATLTNICIVGGGQGDLYKINSFPYGSVTRRCYHSPGNGTSWRITIYTPPCYEIGKDKYPVL